MQRTAAYAAFYKQKENWEDLCAEIKLKNHKIRRFRIEITVLFQQWNKTNPICCSHKNAHRNTHIHECLTANYCDQHWSIYIKQSCI